MKDQNRHLDGDDCSAVCSVKENDCKAVWLSSSVKGSDCQAVCLLLLSVKANDYKAVWLLCFWVLKKMIVRQYGYRCWVLEGIIGFFAAVHFLRAYWMCARTVCETFVLENLSQSKICCFISHWNWGWWSMSLVVLLDRSVMATDKLNFCNEELW